MNEIPIVKKIVRPICEQDEMESRRLWKEVTAGLRFVCTYVSVAWVPFLLYIHLNKLPFYLG